MDGTTLFLIVCFTAFVLCSGVVGVRLLCLARRTGELPERLMGLGLLCLVPINLPLMAWSRMGRVDVGEVRILVLAFALVFLWLGISCLVAFTWKTFRPDDGWAQILTILVCSVAAATITGMFVSVHSSPAEMPSFEATQLWARLVRLPMLVTYAWTGFESLYHYRMAWRRLVLGLGDPVVTNRFLLWGLVSIDLLVVNAASLLLHTQGVGVLASPVGLLVTSIGGLVGAVFLFLIFLPPAAYIRLVRHQA